MCQISLLYFSLLRHQLAKTFYFYFLRHKRRTPVWTYWDESLVKYSEICLMLCVNPNNNNTVTGKSLAHFLLNFFRKKSGSWTTPFDKIDQFQNWPPSPTVGGHKKFKRKCARPLPVTIGQKCTFLWRLGSANSEMISEIISELLSEVISEVQLQTSFQI